VAVGGGDRKGGERRVGQPGWKERRAVAWRNPEPWQNSKEILFKYQLILEFGRTLENCTRRFRRNLDMRIFPKIFYAITGFYKNGICLVMICNLRQN
jgi:hypothetical protein